MKKFPLIIALVTVLVIVFGVFLFSRDNTQSKATDTYEYYWSKTCPHCQNVADFYDTWAKKDVIKIDKYEVLDNVAYARKLIQRGNQCKLPQEEIGGVPLLYTPDGRCITGDIPIIEFYRSL